MGEAEAKEYVIKKLYAEEKKYYSLQYSDLFDSRVSTIYFKGLLVLIKGKWEYFKDYWSDQEILCQSFNLINKEGRCDCHATVPTREEMDMLLSAIYLVRKGVEKYKAEND